MKNMLKTGVVGAIAAVFVASVAVAQSQDQGPGRGSRFHGPGGRGMMPGIMRELTDEQRSQVRAILQEQKPDGEGPAAAARLRRELETELLADTPNDQKIEQLKGQILAAQGEALTHHIAVQKQIAQILTPEQRAKARERLANAPEGRGRGGRPF